jgi:hypothetical protein
MTGLDVGLISPAKKFFLVRPKKNRSYPSTITPTTIITITSTATNATATTTPTRTAARDKHNHLLVHFDEDVAEGDPDLKVVEIERLQKNAPSPPSVPVFSLLYFVKNTGLTMFGV